MLMKMTSRKKKLKDSIVVCFNITALSVSVNCLNPRQIRKIDVSENQATKKQSNVI